MVVSFHSHPTEPVDDPSAPTVESVVKESKVKKEEEGEGTEKAKPQEEEVEEVEPQEAAFNPETGEINWDCPCLGGMAHGPCGEEFRSAFSCFVYSTEEPKGMDCIDKFKYVFSFL